MGFHAELYIRVQIGEEIAAETQRSLKHLKNILRPHSFLLLAANLNNKRGWDKKEQTEAYRYPEDSSCYHSYV